MDDESDNDFITNLDIKTIPEVNNSESTDDAEIITLSDDDSDEEIISISDDESDDDRITLSDADINTIADIRNKKTNIYSSYGTVLYVIITPPSESTESASYFCSVCDTLWRTKDQFKAHILKSHYSLHHWHSLGPEFKSTEVESRVNIESTEVNINNQQCPETKILKICIPKIDVQAEKENLKQKQKATNETEDENVDETPKKKKVLHL